jgi:hypothetical protein
VRFVRFGGWQALTGNLASHLVRLSGGDTELVAKVPSARPRFVQLACMLLVAAAMAGASMFFALQDALGAPWPWSMLFAVAWGAAILATDRLLVTSMSNVRDWRRLLRLALPRLALAALIGVVVATPLVLRVFGPDIESQVHGTDVNQLNQINKQTAAASQVLAGDLAEIPELQVAQQQVNSLETQLVTALQSENVAYERWQCELYGTGSNCKDASEEPGDGPIAKEKQQQYELAAQLVQRLQSQLLQAQGTLAHEQASVLPKAQEQAAARLSALKPQRATLNREINNKVGILAQLRALDELGNHDPGLEAAQYSIFFLFFLIEILPTIASIRFAADPESAYDVAVRTREQELIDRQLGWLAEATAGATEVSPTSRSLPRRTATPSEYLVDEHRRLTDHDPALLRRDVAASLNNLGVLYSALGRRARSLDASREAVDVYRDLAAVDQEFTADLAGSLSNLVTRYAELGNTAKALEAAEEAVLLYRWLGAIDLGQRRAFAASLNNLGVRLAEAGRAAEALDAAQEAASLYRLLAPSNPDILPDLAGSLSNLGTRHAELGQRTQALEAIREAIGLHQSRRLDDPTFIPSLAASLNNLGVQYASLGRATEALEVTEEAVAKYRELVADNPRFLPDLAGSLGNLGALYVDLGRLADALPADEEAVQQYRGLAAGNPALGVRLAASLNNLGVRYASLGRATDALEVTEEAVAKYRELVADNPTFLPDLAGSLSNLGALYVDLGRPADALPAAEEAVALLTDLSTANPVYGAQLAAAAANLAAAFQARYRDTGEEADLDHAVQLLERTLATVPVDYQDRPALLSNLAAAFQARYRSSGDPADLDETVRLLQNALAAAPADYQDRSAILSNLAKISALGSGGR